MSDETAYKMTSPTNSTHPMLGWMCVVIGCYPIIVALDIIKLDESATLAPDWVLVLCGVVFLVAGCMILLRQHARVVDFLAGIICLCFVAVGVWVSIFSSSEGFSGGIPLVSAETNVAISRWVFGGGAVLTLLISVYAFKRAFRKNI